jgi:hypothetical protein
VQVPRSYVEKYAHWLSATELQYICAAPDTLEEHARLCARVLMRSAIAASLGEGIQLSVSIQSIWHVALKHLGCLCACSIALMVKSPHLLRLNQPLYIH